MSTTISIFLFVTKKGHSANSDWEDLEFADDNWTMGDWETKEFGEEESVVMKGPTSSYEKMFENSVFFLKLHKMKGYVKKETRIEVKHDDQPVVTFTQKETRDELDDFYEEYNKPPPPSSSPTGPKTWSTRQLTEYLFKEVEDRPDGMSLIYSAILSKLTSSDNPGTAETLERLEKLMTEATEATKATNA